MPLIEEMLRNFFYLIEKCNDESFLYEHKLILFMNILCGVQEQNVMQTEKFDPRVLLHYGVPSSASILAFDRVQRLLAVGTL
jgi:hypothetical protein